MIKHNFEIKPINLDEIIQYDKEKFNSNNHWANNKRPDDYDEILSNSHTSKWIGLFKPEYITFIIDNPKYIQWIIKASHICSITGKFSNLFADELEQFDLETSQSEYFKSIFNGTGYFVRVGNVSLKYGVNGVGPYYNLKTIIESVVSSIRGHSPVLENTTKLNIYLIPWIEINPVNEFRVFVFENNITAISQQDLYSKLYHKNYPDDLDINKIILQKLNIIVQYFYDEIISKITWTKSYTYDFAICNDKPYFIEMNSFGKEYAAGSALFHWLLDEKILYNRFDNEDSINDPNDHIHLIEFRYTV